MINENSVEYVLELRRESAASMGMTETEYVQFLIEKKFGSECVELNDTFTRDNTPDDPLYANWGWFCNDASDPNEPMLWKQTQRRGSTLAELATWMNEVLSRISGTGYKHVATKNHIEVFTKAGDSAYIL